MLTVAGRRGRRVGGELSWGGLEGGEREAMRALSLAALGSEAARAQSRDGGTDFLTLLLCKEPTQRSSRVVLYTHLGLGQ